MRPHPLFLPALTYFNLVTSSFQNVQGQSALQASIRFLPMVVVGAATNIVTGYAVDKVQVRTLVVGSAIINLVSPLLMALINPSWSYWRAAFFAMLISPLHPDGSLSSLTCFLGFLISHCFTKHPHHKKKVTKQHSVLFTVSNLIISNAYPGEAQSLAGGVFNAVSQVGNSVGLAVTAAIAASITKHDHAGDLEKGYKAAFWTMLAAMVVVCIVTFFGLRKGGKVGGKQD